MRPKTLEEIEAKKIELNAHLEIIKKRIEKIQHAMDTEPPTGNLPGMWAVNNFCAMFYEYVDKMNIEISKMFHKH